MLLLFATDFFGIKLVLGRTFRLEEAGGCHSFAILDYGYWRRHFNFDPIVIARGTTLKVSST